MNNATQPTKRERLERRRSAHHRALASLLGPDADASAGFALWRKLRRIELDLHRTCLEYTNGERNVQLPQWELHKTHARKQRGGDGILAADIT